jgi:hypothetical protein
MDDTSKEGKDESKAVESETATAIAHAAMDKLAEQCETRKAAFAKNLVPLESYHEQHVKPYEVQLREGKPISKDQSFLVSMSSLTIMFYREAIGNAFETKLLSGAVALLASSIESVAKKANALEALRSDLQSYDETMAKIKEALKEREKSKVQDMELAERIWKDLVRRGVVA